MEGVMARDRSVPGRARSAYENRGPRSHGSKTGPSKGSGPSGGGSSGGGGKKGCPFFVLAGLSALGGIAAITSAAAWGVNNIFHVL